MVVDMVGSMVGSMVGMVVDMVGGMVDEFALWWSSHGGHGVIGIYDRFDSTPHINNNHGGSVITLGGALVMVSCRVPSVAPFATPTHLGLVDSPPGWRQNIDLSGIQDRFGHPFIHKARATTPLPEDPTVRLIGTTGG